MDAIARLPCVLYVSVTCEEQNNIERCRGDGWMGRPQIVPNQVEKSTYTDPGQITYFCHSPRKLDLFPSDIHWVQRAEETTRNGMNISSRWFIQKRHFALECVFLQAVGVLGNDACLHICDSYSSLFRSSLKRKSRYLTAICAIKAGCSIQMDIKDAVRDTNARICVKCVHSVNWSSWPNVGKIPTTRPGRESRTLTFSSYHIKRSYSRIKHKDPWLFFPRRHKINCCARITKIFTNGGERNHLFPRTKNVNRSALWSKTDHSLFRVSHSWILLFCVTYEILLSFWPVHTMV